MPKKLFTSPLIIAAFCCFIIAGATILFFPQTQQSAVKGITQKVLSTVTNTPTQTVNPTEGIQEKTSVNKLSPTQIVPTQSNTNHPQQNTSPTSQQVTENKTNAPQTVQVKLTINGSLVGTVEIPQDANQCDILSRAKDQGKITSLLMKYDNSLGTNGVYQINGVGKENTLWWVYKVNGQSPSQGCSYIKANNGDAVVWEYKG